MTSVLILAASEAYDERDGGYPLCLTEINRKPLIQYWTENCSTIFDAKLTLAVQDEDCTRWHLDNVLRRLSADARVLRVRGKTGGAACTALLAISVLDSQEPALILNGNEWLEFDFGAVISEFIACQYDAGVVVFRSVHPRYSYVRLNEEGMVVESAEKTPIGDLATAGFYWFRHGGDFVQAAMQMILKNAHVGGQYYVCPALNELVLRQARIGVHEIGAGHYHPLKSERQIEQFKAPPRPRRITG